MKLKIIITAMRGREEPKIFAQRYWSFREHVKRLQLKGWLPMEGVEWEFGGTMHYLNGQMALPFPEPEVGVNYD